MRASRTTKSPRGRSGRGPIALFLAMLTLGGCMTWRAVPGVPRDFQTGPSAKAIRVRRADGGKVVLTQPRVVSDTLRGLLLNGSSPEEIAIPLSDVVGIEVERVSAGRTVLFVAAVGTAAGLAIAAAADAASSGGSSGPQSVSTGGDYGEYGCGSFFMFPSRFFISAEDLPNSEL